MNDIAYFFGFFPFSFEMVHIYAFLLFIQFNLSSIMQAYRIRACGGGELYTCNKLVLIAPF